MEFALTAPEIPEMITPTGPILGRELRPKSLPHSAGFFVVSQ
jgi:hypothetical protein